jgi:hypothetical protein
MRATRKPIGNRVPACFDLLGHVASAPSPDAFSAERSFMWRVEMTKLIELIPGVAIFAEMGEFAGFSVESQRYIRRSLDVASGNARAIERWSGDLNEGDAVRAQAHIYRRLDQMRAMLRQAACKGQSGFLNLLIGLSTFDLESGDLDGFDPYRFLYERLLGSRARPWLPSAFCAVALLPQVKPIRRIGLLKTLGDSAVGPWSEREPAFYPEQIDA